MTEDTVQPWDPEYSRGDLERQTNSEDEDPWYAEMDLYGMFKSHKYDNAAAAAAQQRLRKNWPASSYIMPKGNEFASVLRKGPVVAFLRKFDELRRNEDRLKEVVDKYKKQKQD